MAQMISQRMSLFNYLHQEHGVGCAEDVQWAMLSLSLPMPEKNEYYNTFEGGALILAEDYGLAYRVTPHNKLLSASVLAHPHILQPLGTRFAANMVLGAYPGIECPARSQETLDFLDESLDEANLNFEDGSKLDNAGHLSYRTAQFPFGYPVVSDIPAVKGRGSPGKVYPGPDIQAQLYGHLRDHFNDPETFFRLCKAEKEKGLLKSTWDRANGHCLKEYSRNFGIRLMNDPFHHRILG